MWILSVVSSWICFCLFYFVRLGLEGLFFKVGLGECFLLYRGCRLIWSFVIFLVENSFEGVGVFI